MRIRLSLANPDVRAWLIIVAAAAGTVNVAALYALGRAPYMLLVFLAVCTVGLIVAWARRRGILEQRRQGRLTDTEISAHMLIDGGTDSRPFLELDEIDYEMARRIGVFTAVNGIAIVPAHHAGARPMLVAVRADGSARAIEQPAGRSVLPAIAILNHVSICTHRKVDIADRAAAAALAEYFHVMPRAVA
ncbi:hypothetical protein RN607_00560 [Demequina capsici]|uniref:Uncharacterized protein n=1 Tax=Demequina capsici TaxID=3075620 RepID=A0AA96JG35_9MICO|nr:hypothetical protein [Demequina sp. PMTSA13]WNM27524.1 hypothetical protein RN607_00560 [Demequina sp. PMTSA13]